MDEDGSGDADVEDALLVASSVPVLEGDALAVLQRAVDARRNGCPGNVDADDVEAVPLVSHQQGGAR